MPLFVAVGQNTNMLTKTDFIRSCLPQLGGGELTSWDLDSKPNSEIIRAVLTHGTDSRRLIIKQLNSDHTDGRFGRTGEVFWRRRFDAQIGALRACSKSPDARLSERTPAPLAWDAATLSLCMDEIPGCKLDVLFDRAVRWAPPQTHWRAALRACREAGEWLVAFHALDTAVLGIHDETDGLTDWADYCDSRLDRVISCNHLGRGARQRIARKYGQMAKDWGRDGSRVLVHNDLQSDNILCTERGIVVLDFTGVALGPPEWDAIKFTQSISKWAFTRPFVTGRIEKLKQAFLDGYGQVLDQGGAAWRAWEFAWALDKLSDLIEDGLIVRPTLGVRLRTRALLRLML
jgi:hypothetical protein